MYFDNTEDNNSIEFNLVFTVIIIICTIPTLFLIINWSSLYTFIENSVLIGIGN